MTKTELIERAAARWDGSGLNLSKLGRKVLISDVLGCILDEVEDAVKDKVEVKIEGFGTLKPTYCEPTQRHDLHTGGTITRDGGYSLRFRPSKRLKDALKE